MAQRYVVAYGNGGINPSSGALVQGTNSAGGSGAQNFAVTYDAPIITWSLTANLPSSVMLETVTISGINFGYTDSTPESYVGVSYCRTTTWSSATAMACQAVQGSGPARAVAAALFQGAGSGKYHGTRLATFTFDAPSVSFMAPPNTASTGGFLITVEGFNFGAQNFTLTGKLGFTSCATISWKTTSYLTCIAAAGLGTGLEVTVTVAGVVGTLGLARYSYDSPILSQVVPQNVQSASGYSLTFLGSNFGAQRSSPTASVGSAVCASTQWIGQTSVLCTAPIGSSSTLTVSLTVAGLVGTLAGPFSFDGTGACAAVRRLGTFSTMIAARCAQLQS
jgi:hypothetical protein